MFGTTSSTVLYPSSSSSSSSSSSQPQYPSLSFTPFQVQYPSSSSSSPPLSQPPPSQSRFRPFERKSAEQVLTKLQEMKSKSQTEQSLRARLNPSVSGVVLRAGAPLVDEVDFIAALKKQKLAQLIAERLYPVELQRAFPRGTVIGDLVYSNINGRNDAQIASELVKQLKKKKLVRLLYSSIHNRPETEPGVLTYDDVVYIQHNYFDKKAAEETEKLLARVLESRERIMEKERVAEKVVKATQLALLNVAMEEKRLAEEAAAAEQFAEEAAEQAHFALLNVAMEEAEDEERLDLAVARANRIINSDTSDTSDYGAFENLNEDEEVDEDDERKVEAKYPVLGADTNRLIQLKTAIQRSFLEDLLQPGVLLDLNVYADNRLMLPRVIEGKLVKATIDPATGYYDTLTFSLPNDLRRPPWFPSEIVLRKRTGRNDVWTFDHYDPEFTVTLNLSSPASTSAGL